VDAKQALADLTEISSQVEAAVVFDDGGRVAGSTVGDAARAAELAQAAGRLLAAAEEVKTGESALSQLEVATGEGSVFIVRDGKTSIVATTGGNPTVGLVFYDLKSALRALAAQPAAKRTPAKKTTTTAAKKTTTAAKKKAASTKKQTASRKQATRKKPDAS
jgi:predicted regulator of Ras-like GTPase activity (Roadblock/LC7/MglB family)